MTRHLARFAIVALALTAPLAAQTTTTASPLAPCPHMVIDTVGPDGWRLRFGPTNLGSLLESEQGQALWQPGVLPILAGWQTLLGDEAAFAASKQRLLGYSGRIRIAFWLGEGELEQQPLAMAALVADGDGRTDLAALAADVKLAQNHLGGEWEEREVAGERQQVRVMGDEVMTAATVQDGRLVVFLAANGKITDTVGIGRTYASATPAEPLPPTTPALLVHIELPAILALAKASGSEQDNAILHALGIDELGNFDLRLGTAGPHVQVGYQQDLPPAPRGLVAAFAPKSSGVSTLQRLVPKDAIAWKVGHFDLGALWEGAIDALVASGMGNTEDELRAEMKKETGIDPSQDLFPHLTDEVLFVGSSLRGLDRPEEFTWVLGWRLKDDKAFATNFAKVLASANPMLSREATETVHGMEFQRYGNMLGYDLWFATGNGLVLVGGGRDVEEWLTMLAKNAAVPVAADAPALPMPAEFAGVRTHLPPGLTGVARGDIDTLLTLPADWWLMILGEVLPFPIRPRDGELSDDPEAREAMQEMLRKHNLGTVRTATGRDKNTFHWRLYW